MKQLMTPCKKTDIQTKIRNHTSIKTSSKTAKKTLSLLLALLLITSLFATTLAIPAAASAPAPVIERIDPPTDVKGDTHERAILTLHGYYGLEGLLSVDYKFYPGEPCTQAAFIQILTNLYGNQFTVKNGWLGICSNNVATQGWATSVLTDVSAQLGHVITWRDGSPTANITRGEACSYIVALLDCSPSLLKLVIGRPSSTNPPIVSTPTFDDVSITSYYYTSINWAVTKGIVYGVSPTIFNPDSPCTISQILVMLWRANGSPTVKAECPFSNIPTTDYAYGALCWAGQRGLIADDSIDPATAPCTRAYIVTCLWKLAGQPRSSTAVSFADVPTNASYTTAVRWAIQYAITSGTSATTFSPMEQVTRGQAVTFLYRTYA